MTRKRFIKLMMSQGYDRNGANRLADEAVGRNIPYATFYYINGKAVQLLNYGFVAIEELKRALQPVMDEIKRAVQIVADALAPIAREICKAMSESE